MPIMELKEYKDGSILNKLKQNEDCPKMLLTITNFAFSNMVQNLMHQLDSEFESKRGRPAYPRTLLLIVVLYCFSIDIQISSNRYLRIKAITQFIRQFFK